MARITTFNEEDLTFDELQIVNMKRQIQDLRSENRHLKNELYCYKDSMSPDVSEMIDMKRRVQKLEHENDTLSNELYYYYEIFIDDPSKKCEIQHKNNVLENKCFVLEEETKKLKAVEKYNNKRIEKLEKTNKKLSDALSQGYMQDYKFNKEHAGIYRIYNKMTGESYVGQSHVDVYNRCMSHYIQAEWPESDWHYDLINNPDNYEYEILKEGVENQGDLDKLEIYYMGYYHCLDEGYNKAFEARYRFLGLHENEEI